MSADPHTVMNPPAAGRRWQPTPFMYLTLALHAVCMVGLLVAPARWAWWLGALVANHVVITAAGLWPRSTLLGPNWRRLPAHAAGHGEIAITIDDGPDPEVTPRVLEILARYQARATFFCIGTRAAQHPELVQAILRAGHEVQNHSQHHTHNFSFQGPRGFAREIAAAQATLAGLTGKPPRFFRAPAGLRNPFLEPVLVREGLTLASWTRRGFDTRETDPQKVAARLLSGLAAGDILLLHDGHAARTANGTPVILDVLPQLLDAVRYAGLTTVTLEQARP